MGIGSTLVSVEMVDGGCVEETECDFTDGGAEIDDDALATLDLKVSSTSLGSALTLTNSFKPAPNSSFCREDGEGAEGCLAKWTVKPLRKKN